MTTRIFSWLPATLLVLTIGTTPVASQPKSANSADEIDTSNQIMFEAAQSAGTSPFLMTWMVAIVQSAVFDAVNGTERRYTSVHVTPAAEPGASQRAAAVLAAYTTLASICPSQKSNFDQQLVTSLASIASDAAADHGVSIARGAAWGETVGQAILEWRSTDGFTPPPPPFLGGLAPRGVAAHTARVSARSRCAVLVHDAVGDPVAAPVPAFRSARVDKRSVHGGFQRGQGVG